MIKIGIIPYYNNELLLKMFHLGPTNNIHFCQISIEELKEIITHE